VQTTTAAEEWGRDSTPQEKKSAITLRTLQKQGLRSSEDHNFRRHLTEQSPVSDKKGSQHLSKEDSIEVTGKVVEKFKAGMSSLELEADPAVLATLAGRLRRNRIKMMNHDPVIVALRSYEGQNHLPTRFFSAGFFDRSSRHTSAGAISAEVHSCGSPASVTGLRGKSSVR